MNINEYVSSLLEDAAELLVMDESAGKNGMAEKFYTRVANNPQYNHLTRSMASMGKHVANNRKYFMSEPYKHAARQHKAYKDLYLMDPEGFYDPDVVHLTDPKPSASLKENKDKIDKLNHDAIDLQNHIKKWGK